MKHLNRYNEEWNPFKAKDPNLVIIETTNSVTSTAIHSIESKKDGDTTFHVTLTLSPQKVQQLKLESGSVEIKYHGYKRETDTNVTIVVQEVRFRMNTGITEAKYFGGREKSRDFSYTDPKIGNIHVYPTMILIDRYSRTTAIDLGYGFIPYDKKTLKSGLTKFFEDSIEKLPNILDLVKKSLEERKIVVAKQREESDKHMSKVKQFIENKEAIQECFYDLIDMSDNFKINEEGNSVVLIFDIKGIDIKKQEKSKSTTYKYETARVEFDEAHIGITDEIINVFTAIRDAKSHLVSMDENVSMDTVFKKNRLQITLKIIKK